MYYVDHQGNSELPALLFLHGFMGSCADFRPVVTMLSEQFHCICVDLPGHGRTQVQHYDLPRTARDVVDLVAGMSIRKPIGLVGYSLGGRIALYLALRYPQLWSKVVLESASAGLMAAGERWARRQQDEAIARQLAQPALDWPGFVERWYQQPVFRGVPEHPDFSKLLTQRLDNRPRELARSLVAAGLGAQPYLGDFLVGNDLPLLLLVGENDSKFLAINRELAVLCRSAVVVVIPGCSHNVHWQQPLLWCQAVRDWFE